MVVPSPSARRRILFVCVTAAYIGERCLVAPQSTPPALRQARLPQLSHEAFILEPASLNLGIWRKMRLTVGQLARRILAQLDMRCPTFPSDMSTTKSRQRKILKQCIVSFLVAIHWEKNFFSPSCIPAQWTHILWCCPILGQTSHIWSIMLTLSGSRSWEVFRSLPLPLPGPTIMFFTETLMEPFRHSGSDQVLQKFQKGHLIARMLHRAFGCREL